MGGGLGGKSGCAPRDARLAPPVFFILQTEVHFVKAYRTALTKWTSVCVVSPTAGTSVPYGEHWERLIAVRQLAIKLPKQPIDQPIQRGMVHSWEHGLD